MSTDIDERFKNDINISYDVPSLSKYFDIINLMMYNFHGSWDNRTEAHAPLHSKPDATGTDLEYTVEYAMNYFLTKGADPNKIVDLFKCQIVLIKSYLF